MLELRQVRNMLVCGRHADHWSILHSRVITVQVRTDLYNAGKCVDNCGQEEVGVVVFFFYYESIEIYTLQEPATPQT